MTRIGTLAAFALAASLVRPAAAWEQRGVASVFGAQRVACAGLRYGPMTAAHRTADCGAKLRVRHNCRIIVVQVVDRGPFRRGRIIDLSGDAGRALGIDGLGAVSVSGD